MTLLSGRLFTAADDAQAPRVAVVNLSMARHYFSDADPIGRRVSLDDGTTWIDHRRASSTTCASTGSR